MNIILYFKTFDEIVYSQKGDATSFMKTSVSFFDVLGFMFNGKCSILPQWVQQLWENLCVSSNSLKLIPKLNYCLVKDRRLSKKVLSMCASWQLKTRIL